MDEERPISEGTVTISIREYRDLIERATLNECRYSQLLAEKWKDKSTQIVEVNTDPLLKEEAKSLRKQNERFADFLASDKEVAERYKNYLTNKKKED